MSWKSLYENAYVPYSNQPRACIVESKSGEFFAGVRIENISYPLTIPALQAAFSICLSEGEIPAKIYVKETSIDQLGFWRNEFQAEIIETNTPPLHKVKNHLITSDNDFNVQDRLTLLLSRAVTPNSDFPVSALLFVENGVFEGVNTEVSEWSKGLCAERVTLSKAVAAGYTDFLRMEVHAQKGEYSSPCGACRQVIHELLPYHEIKLHHSDGTTSEHLTLDLLPFSFKSSALKK